MPISTTFFQITTTSDDDASELQSDLHFLAAAKWLPNLHATAIKAVTDAPNLPPPERDVAGRLLGRQPHTDTRTSVALQDGLPTMDWVKIPEIDPHTGQREFIYQDDERRTESTFWIARYPVTYSQTFPPFVDADDGFRNPKWWEGLAASESHRSKPGEQRFEYWNHPRENISWYDAMAFCCWLAAKMKAHVDLLPPELRSRDDWQITLPTEWQWEKAARGYDGRAYPWGDEYRSGYVNINETRSADKAGVHNLQKTSAVGAYPQGASPFGVQDMSGNVWEWCLNEYDKPDRIQAGGDATRVVRGGSWRNYIVNASARFRNGDDPYARFLDVGFRVVLCFSVPIHSGSTL